MDFGLQGRWAYVTGGAAGIGKGVCEVLLEEGANLVAADIQEDVLRENVREWPAGRVKVIGTDLSTRAGAVGAAQMVLEELGRAPDIVINNVGAGKFCSFEEVSDADVDEDL